MNENPLGEARVAITNAFDDFIRALDVQFFEEENKDIYAAYCVSVARLQDRRDMLVKNVEHMDLSLLPQFLKKPYHHVVFVTCTHPKLIQRLDLTIIDVGPPLPIAQFESEENVACILQLTNHKTFVVLANNMCGVLDWEKMKLEYVREIKNIGSIERRAIQFTDDKVAVWSPYHESFWEAAVTSDEIVEKNHETYKGCECPVEIIAVPPANLAWIADCSWKTELRQVTVDGFNIPQPTTSWERLRGNRRHLNVSKMLLLSDGRILMSKKDSFIIWPDVELNVEWNASRPEWMVEVERGIVAVGTTRDEIFFIDIQKEKLDDRKVAGALRKVERYYAGVIGLTRDNQLYTYSSHNMAPARFLMGDVRHFSPTQKHL